MVNVHLVPHTHDDVGWVRTVDELFYEGESQNILSISLFGRQVHFSSISNHLAIEFIGHRPLCKCTKTVTSL